ncbi:MAG: glycosyltransferase family 39 protein [Patescibacteria group bacterium]|nr:glycosyltransferase family 39 protein [Patescibacteria group bacterium]
MLLQKIAVYVQRFILALIILSAALFMLNAARGDSAIFDETAHIVAGYNNLVHQDYRFNPEHPPLMKMLAAVPLAFEHLSLPTDQGYWTGVNEQWWAGNYFLYHAGNNADQIIFSARIFPIIVTLLLILMTYIFAVEVVGRWWALLPAFLVGFSPMILAHGHYVTTDTGAAFGIMFSLYWFIRYLLDPQRKNLVIAGLAFGVAQSIKFSAVLLIPAFALIVAAFLGVRIAQEWNDVAPESRLRKFSREAYRVIGGTLLVGLIGYVLVVYPLYRYATWQYPAVKQVADTEALIGGFSFSPASHLTIAMAGNPVLRPFAEYALGVIMVFQRQAGGNGAFFLGELSSRGWHYYFPLMYLMKESLPTLILLLIAVVIGCSRMLESFRHGAREAGKKLLEYATVHFVETGMFIFVALYWASSISSPLNIGVRHILPTIPLFYILGTSAIRKWFAVRPSVFEFTVWDRLYNVLYAIFNIWVKAIAIGCLVIWVMFEAGLASPYFLSYYNQLFGWHTDGFYFATDSNFDWGQDLKRLTAWTDANLAPGEKIAVDYFGGGDAGYYLGDRYVAWSSAQGNPADENIHWLAVSVNSLQGAEASLAPDFTRNPLDEYLWLNNPYQPAARVGTSIFIYHL